MNFSNAMKVFQLNILRQSGVTVTPQQVGLKSDPIADLQASNSKNSFNTMLSRIAGVNNLQMPTPPTPPADAADTAAQATYQQELLTYNQNFQIYNQRMMQVMISQIQALQQSIATNASQKTSTDSTSSSSSDVTALSVGGIL